MIPLFVVLAPVCALIILGALMGAAYAGAVWVRLCIEVFHG